MKLIKRKMVKILKSWLSTKNVRNSAKFKSLKNFVRCEN